MNVAWFRAIAITVAILGLTGCGSSTSEPPRSSDPWPTSYADILTGSITDPPNDLVKAFEGAPPYSTPVSYPSVDVTKVSFGIQGKYFYLRFDFAGILPKDTVSIPRMGEIEPQAVLRQGCNLSIDSDNNNFTGAFGDGIAGVDIFFAVAMFYGNQITAYANFDFPPPGDPHYQDVHYNRGHIDGEFGEGGPGSSYFILRFDMSTLGGFLPRGATVEVGGWSEAESDRYHHFAFDTLTASTWAIPPN